MAGLIEQRSGHQSSHTGANHKNLLGLGACWEAIGNYPTVLVFAIDDEGGL